jgi:protein TonB
MNIRAITSLLSMAIHAAVASFFFVSIGSASLDSGEGEDDFTVEQGISIEGVQKLGDAEFATEAVEVEPTQMSEARPEIEEIKAEEKVEEDELLTSPEGPVQEEIPEVKPEPLEQPRPAQTATIEQMEQVKVEELQSSGEKKEGGGANEMAKYRGDLFRHFHAKKVNPRSQKTGTVVVKFKVDAAGSLVSREIVTSSGHAALDEAAIATIDRSAPYPPIPEGIGKQVLELSVPFRFSIR